jgi:D-alanine-D-alanine ligase
MENKKVIILHNAVTGNSNPDEADVLHQVELVAKALTVLGYMPIAFPLQDDLIHDLESIRKSQPVFVFNLVEAVFNKGELLYIGPALLSALKIPYTGVPVEGLFLTTNKVLTKKILEYNHIPTPGYFTTNEIHLLRSGTRYLLKPVSEDGSVGLDEDAVFTVEQTAFTDNISRKHASHYFIEEYIEGREFNISILGGKGRRDTLPPAEMLFHDYPEGKPRILGYKSKWDESSTEYKNTTRAFGTLTQESPLYRELVRLTEACWDCFNLKGFARVDFRVDRNGHPFVIEINGNPCISPDSGFIAAANQAGFSNTDVIARIIEELT